MIRRNSLAAVTTLMMLGSVPNVAQAYVSSTLNPERFGDVQVLLGDNATGGCWTNLGEAKTYVEDQLRRLGYAVVTEETLGTFAISVASARMNNGLCYGNIHLQMYRPEIGRDLFGFLEVAALSYTFVNHSNANIGVLDKIKLLIDEMEMKQREQ